MSAALSESPQAALLTGTHIHYKTIT
jgi:hypothetical protein